MVEKLQRAMQVQGRSCYKVGRKFDDSVRIYAAGPQDYPQQFLWLRDEERSQVVFDVDGCYGDIPGFKHHQQQQGLR